MSIRRLFCFALPVVLLMGTLLTACGEPAPAGKETAKPIVAVTIVPQKTFVEAVCGDLVQVQVLVPPGNSPENYEPTPKAMEAFTKADIFFAIGVPAEDTGILAKAASIHMVRLDEEVAKEYPELEFEPGERDHHIWLSPRRVQVMIEVIAREMGMLDEANSETYTQNAAAYIEQLEQLDADIAAALDGVQNRQFLVYHPAFAYIAADYNLEMLALEEEGKESTAKRLQEMVDLAKQNNVKVFFYQAEMDSRQVRAFAEEIGAETRLLEPLSPDYIENLKNMADLMAEAMQ